ncbi:MAG: helix-turn-helix transcriptional regulator [Clostridiales bacterium]|nr:helix-turn-helix transcriptional regulator [Clostridiales bacterium]
MISSDIIRGHLDAIILKLIIEKDRYGYEISKEISQRTDGVFEIKEATLYAVFQRLEKKELIVSYSGEITHGRKRKYYKVTALGKAFFSLKEKEWKTTKEIINTFMEEKV